MFRNLINRLTTGIVKIASYADVITFNSMKLTSKLLNVLPSDSKFPVLCKFNWIRHFPSQPEILNGLSDQDKFMLIALKRTKDGDMLFHYLAKNNHFDVLRVLYHSFFGTDGNHLYKLIIPYLSNFDYKTILDFLPEYEKKYYKSEKKSLQNYKLSVSDFAILKHYLITLKIYKNFDFFGVDIDALFRDLKSKAKDNGLNRKPKFFIEFGNDENNGYRLNESVIIPFGKVEFLVNKSIEWSKSTLGKAIFSGDPFSLIRACLQFTIGHELGHMHYADRNVKSMFDKIIQEKIYKNHSLLAIPYDMVFASVLSGICLLPSSEEFEISNEQILAGISAFVLPLLSRLYFNFQYSKSSRNEEQAADKFSADLSDDCLKGQYAYFRFLAEKEDRKENDPFSSHPGHADRAKIAGQKLINKGYQLS